MVPSPVATRVFQAGSGSSWRPPGAPTQPNQFPMKRNQKQTGPEGLKERIRQLLRTPNYRPLDKAELSKALHWPSDQRSDLRTILREMETAGEIARIRKDRYVLPQTADLVTGTLQVHTGGNAHLLAETPGT